jgi:hypothetical protein
MEKCLKIYLNISIFVYPTYNPFKTCSITRQTGENEFLNSVGLSTSFSLILHVSDN